ncbi:acyltransferase family protein [Sphingomonas sp. HITSZ_GF]|uniref:acyltransferase family protein n=1 Tax=Sphingomonas sp. HITSZ_GF TaxID=3037247 RepID=UPI00240E3968|nr:acyltransferase family protein [Sphingomonas sp. HITSZ_GF]MDG2535782.1 acyltransferase family protein [Sphingomonas sp. HITSZ_GF]
MRGQAEEIPATAARDQSLDALRGALIIAVIVGHFPFQKLAGPTHDVVWALGEIFYLFHVSAFFALSGVLVKPFKSWSNTVRGVAPLITAYLFWVLVSRAEYVTGLQWVRIADLVVFANSRAINGIMWFLPVLVSLRLVMQAYFSVPRPVRLLFLAVSAGTVLFHGEVERIHGWVPWGLDTAFYHLPIALAARHLYLNRRPGDARFVVPALLFLVAVAALYIFQPMGVLHRILIADFVVPANPPLYLALGVTVCALIVAAARIRPPYFLVVAGLFSFPIYILHAKLLQVGSGFIGIGGPWLSPILFVLLTAAATLIPVLVSAVASAVSFPLARYFGMAPGSPDPRWRSLRSIFLRRDGGGPVQPT